MQNDWLIVGNNFLLGNGIIKIFKRKYKAIGVSYKEMFEPERVIGLSLYEKIGGALIESECLVAGNNMDAMRDSIEKLIKFCHERKLKCVFVQVQNPTDCDVSSDLYQRYCIACESIAKMVETVFVVHSVYEDGSNLKIQEKGRDSHCADVVALFIEKNIDRQGRIPVCNNIGIDEQEVIKHQSRCVFKLIYELKPQCFFYEKRVAEIRFQMGESLAKVVPHQVVTQLDCVCPVPKTGMYYAMGLAHGLKCSYVQALLKTDGEERSFQIENTDKRKQFLWSKLQPIRELIQGKTLAVVDEAIFTGATLKAVVEMLHACGAKGIYLCIPTPKCRNHCNYLVQPPRPMLLEYVRDTMLEEYFNVDGVFFQNDEVFKQYINGIDGQMCSECFGGGGYDE